MSVRDRSLIFCENQAITGTSAVSGIVDAGVGLDEFGNPRTADLGAGGDIWVEAIVGDKAVAGATAINVTVEHSDDNVSFSPHMTLYNKKGSLGDKGTQLARGPLAPDHKRYLRLKYNLTGAATAGTVSGHLIGNA